MQGRRSPELRSSGESVSRGAVNHDLAALARLDRGVADFGVAIGRKALPASRATVRAASDLLIRAP